MKQKKVVKNHMKRIWRKNYHVQSFFFIIFCDLNFLIQILVHAHSDENTEEEKKWFETWTKKIYWNWNISGFFYVSVRVLFISPTSVFSITFFFVVLFPPLSAEFTLYIDITHTNNAYILTNIYKYFVIKFLFHRIHKNSFSLFVIRWVVAKVVILLCCSVLVVEI